MKYLIYFLAGFFSTLIAHQGLLYLFSIAEIAPHIAYNMNAVKPFAVPAVISLAFFGGLWGILLGKYLENTTRDHFWLKSFLFGAFLPTIVALAVVFPLKNIPLSADKALLGFVLNGAWGLGTAAVVFIKERYPLIRKYHAGDSVNV